jgi:hypothetical protein
MIGVTILKVQIEELADFGSEASSDLDVTWRAYSFI